MQLKNLTDFISFAAILLPRNNYAYLKPLPVGNRSQ
jgi:hypothetical protein